MKDYYRVLGVHPKAEPEVIKAAYNGLAKKCRPDLNPSPSATERMKEINEAHEVLSDPVRRAGYEREYVSHFGNEFSTDPPVLKVRPKTLNFGELAAGSKVEKRFVVENHGGPLKGRLNIDGSQCRGWATVSARPNSGDSDFPLEVTVEVDTANLPPGWVLGKIHQARILLQYLDEEIAVVLRLTVLPSTSRRSSTAQPSSGRGRSPTPSLSPNSGIDRDGVKVVVFLGLVSVLSVVALLLSLSWLSRPGVLPLGAGQETAGQPEIDRVAVEFAQVLEKLDLRMRLVSYDEERDFLVYDVYIRNNDDNEHPVALYFEECPEDQAPIGALDMEWCGGKPDSATMLIEAHSTTNFPAGCSLQGTILPGVSITDLCGLRVRIDEIDGVINPSPFWNWQIGIFDEDGQIYPWFVNENWEKIGPADRDFDDPSKEIEG